MKVGITVLLGVFNPETHGAGVDHAARVTALMEGGAILALDHRDLGAWVPPLQGPAHPQADDPGSGDTGPRPGRIAVSGGSGDVVTIDGERLLLTDGLGVADHADGRAVVRVVGGGRQLAFTVGVAEDNVTWVDAEPPAHTRVLFPSGSPRLSADAKQRIAAFVASLGDWHVELYGSYSPDGAERVNRALGQTRAEAVRDALIAAGVPADHIHIGPVQPPADGLDAVEARNATLAPVEAP